VPADLNRMTEFTEERVAWTLAMDSLTSMYGRYPSVIPYGRWIAACGVDLTKPGVASRMRGTALWGDMILQEDFREILIDTETYSDWEDRGFDDVQTFSILSSADTDERVWGLIGWQRASGHAWIYAKRSSIDYQDLHDHTDNQPIFTSIPVDCDTPETPADFPNGFRVTSRGKFIYLWAPGEAALTNRGESDPDDDYKQALNRVLWFDPDHADNFDGFVMDLLGVPGTGVWSEENTLAGQSRMLCQIADKYNTNGADDLDMISRGLTLSTWPVVKGTSFTATFDLTADGVPAGWDAADTYTMEVYRNDNLTTPGDIIDSKTDSSGAGTTKSFGTFQNVTDYPDSFVLHFRIKNVTESEYLDDNDFDQWFHCAFKNKHYTQSGQYRLAYNLYDSFRERESNLSTTDADQCSDEMAYTLRLKTEVNAGAKGLSLTDGILEDVWKNYQVWSSLSTLDDAQTPPEVGLYYVDKFKPGTFWNASSVVQPSPGTDVVSYVNVFHGKTRRDEDPYIDLALTTDTAIAANSPYDIGDDVYRVWDTQALDADDAEQPVSENLANVVAAITMEGCHYCVQKRDGEYYLIWSDTRAWRYENFPVDNEYQLDYTSDTIALVRAGNYLFVFGDDKVYVVQRDGYFVSVGEALTGVSIVSREAVCATENAVVAVTDKGVFLLDGVSGTPVLVDNLHRLMMQRWRSQGHRKSIQVAYDEHLDVIMIFCARASEMVWLHMGTQQIQFVSGVGYSWLREIKTPLEWEGEYTDDEEYEIGPVRRRAILVSRYGKVVFFLTSDDDPRIDLDVTWGAVNVEATTYRRASMHAVPDFTVGLSVDTAPNPYIVQATNRTVNGEDVTRLYLNGIEYTTSSVHAAWYVLSGVTIQILTGPRAGEIHQCIYGEDPGAGLDGYINIRGQFTDKDTAFAGQYIAISPIPFLLIGAPLSGQTSRLWSERKYVDSASVVLTELDRPALERDNLEAWGTYGFTYGIGPLPVLKVGVCEIGALTGANNLTPTDGWTYLPDPGPLPQLIDWSHESVRLADVPTEGGVPPTEEVIAVALDETYGASGTVLFPVVTSWLGGVGFDLLQAEFYGTISSNETNSLGDS
jgi:hypothetical protein